MQFAYRIFIQPVAFFTCGYVPVYVSTYCIKMCEKHNGRCNAVAIVIAVYGYLYFIVNRFFYRLHSFIHIRNKQGVGKLRTVEILLCLLGCVYSSADKQTAQKHRQSRVGLEFHCKCIVRISDKPFFHKKLYPLDKFFQFFRCKTIFVIAEMTAHFRDRLFLCKLCKLVLAECYQHLLGTLS